MRDERGQATTEYILILSFAVVGASAIARGIIGGIDKGILRLGAELERDLKSGRLSHRVSGQIELYQYGVTALALAAMATDLAWGRIFNWLTLGGARPGDCGLRMDRRLGRAPRLRCWARLRASRFNGWMFWLRFMGGGDVKLLMALGAWGGAAYAAEVALLGVLCGRNFRALHDAAARAARGVRPKGLALSLHVRGAGAGGREREGRPKPQHAVWRADGDRRGLGGVLAPSARVGDSMRFARDQRGQATTEYILIIAMVVAIFLLVQKSLKRFDLAGKLATPVTQASPQSTSTAAPTTIGYDEGEP